MTTLEDASGKTLKRIDVEGAAPSGVPEELFEAILAVDGVRQVVALPDIHHKPHKEVPSSVAIATRGTYVPNFSSVNQNCGMAYIRTQLRADSLDERSLEHLTREVRARVDVTNESGEPRVDRELVQRSVLEGARAICDRYDLDPEALARVELGGNWLGPGGADPELLDLIPERIYELGRRLFGLLGFSNHFIELQAVEEVVDAEVCSAYGIEAGQLFVLYHTDSLGFGGEIGFLYGSRPQRGWRGAVRQLLRKAAFHRERLGRSEWRAAVLGRSTFNPVRVDTPVGEKLLAANALNTNFGYANRFAVGAWIIQALKAFDPASAPTLFVDSNHNSVRAESIGGESLLVHRHNSVRVLLPEDLPPGSPFERYGAPVLLPGYNDTSSYLALPTAGARDSLFSADHGAAKMMARMHDLGPRPDRRTRKYSYRSGSTEEVPHRGDAGIEAMVRTLEGAGVLRAIARLRPIATLKA